MEQENSLSSELQNIARIQQEQLQTLKDMKESDDSTKVMNSVQGNSSPNFNSAGMYNYSAPAYAAGFGVQNSNPYADRMSANFSGHMQSLQSAGGKYGFLNIVNPGTGYSLQSRDLMSMDYSSKLGKAGAAGVGAAANLGLMFGSSAILPGAAAFGLSMGAGAIAGLFTDNAINEIDKSNALNKYIYKTSGRYINSFESSNDRAVSGFSRDQSKTASNFVRTMNDEFYMKDDEMMTLLQKYTEGGLLKDVKDLDTFKEKMTSLTKSVKEGAIMLNETYDSIADLMSEMKKIGLDTKDFGSLSGFSNIMAGITGGDASEMVRTILGLVEQINSGTGNSNTNTVSTMQNTMTYLGSYFNELQANTNRNLTEDGNFNYVNNLGGIENASAQMVSTMQNMLGTDQMKQIGILSFDYADGEFAFNEKSFKDLLRSGMSYRDMEKLVQTKMQGYEDSGQGAAILKWNQQGASLMQRSFNDQDLLNYTNSVVNGMLSESDFKDNGMTTQEMLSMMGMSNTDMQNLFTGVSNYASKNQGLIGSITLQNMWQQQATEAVAESPSLTEIAGSLAEKTGDFFAGGAVKFNNWLGDKVYDFSNWVSGVDKRIPVKYDGNFQIKSDLETISYEDVTNELAESNKLLASATESLKSLGGQGYNIDNSIMQYIQSKFDTSNSDITYTRDVISDWSTVASDISDKKDSITSIAAKNAIKETIVASLEAYEARKAPNQTSINVSDTAKLFSSNLVQYGGNEQLAMAAVFAGNDNIDSQLQAQGYNLSALRSVGAQTTLQGFDTNNLNLSNDVKTQVSDVFGQQVFAGGSSYSDITTTSLTTRNLKNKSTITADQLNSYFKDNLSTESLFQGQGQAFIDAQNKSGIDALYIAGIAINESGGGTSNIAKNKNNFFGWGAIDSNPYNSAKQFSGSVADGIVQGAMELGTKYVNNEKYVEGGQSTLYAMNNTLGHSYATDSGWADKAASHVKQIVDYVGDLSYQEGQIQGNTTAEKVVRDKNGNIIPVIDKKSGKLYDQQSTSKLYNDGSVSNFLQYSKGLSNYESLKLFGYSFLDLDPNDKNFNVQLNDQAGKFYDQYSEQFKNYLTGKNSVFTNMSLDERLGYVNTLTSIEKGLGRSGGVDSIYSQTGKTIEDLATAEERNQYSDLYKDKNGKWKYGENKDKEYNIYDKEIPKAGFFINEKTPSGPEEKPNTIHEYAAWVADGKQYNKFDDLKGELESKGISVTSDISIADLETAVKKQKSDIMSQNNDKVQLFNKIFSKKGIERATLQDLTEIGVGTSSLSQVNYSHREALLTAVRSGDVSKVEAFKSSTLNESGGVDKVISLMNAINGVDTSSLDGVLDNIENMKDVYSDMGSTAAMFYGNGENGIAGSDFANSFKTAVQDAAVSIFSDNETLSGASIEELINALKGDKIDGVELSADNIEQLSAAIAAALDGTLEQTFKNNDSLEKFVNSEAFKSLTEKSDASITFDGNSMSVSETVDKIKDLNDRINSATEKTADKINAQEERDSLVQQIIDATETSFTELGKSANDAKDGIEGAAGNLKTSSDNFITALKLYDASIAEAITTLEKRIDKKGDTWVTVQPSAGMSLSRSSGFGAG